MKISQILRSVDVRNEDRLSLPLMGLSMEKYFIPSVANTIGSDMTKYKIIKSGQFAANFIHVGRDGKVPIALYEGSGSLVSSAYYIFEVKDINTTLPEYLMLKFKNPEFDREATFYASVGIRGGLELDDFYNLEFNIPPIEEQRKIVEQYQTIERRIKNNEALIQKLEATAQALYHHTFVEGIDKENLPEGWRMGCLEDVTRCFDNKRKPLSGSERDSITGDFPYYGATSIMDYVNDYIFDGEYLLIGEDGSVVHEDGSPYLQLIYGKTWVNNHAHVLSGVNGFDNNLLYWTLKTCNIANYVTGAVQLKLNQKNMNAIPIVIPNNDTLVRITSELTPIMNYWELIHYENSLLSKSKNLLANLV